MHTKLKGSNPHAPALPSLLPLIFMVMAWLNPIHNPPWLGFWSDSFAAIAFLLIFLKIALQFKNDIELPKLAIVFLLVSLLPWCQYAFGLISYVGVAWLHFAYLLGFSLAFLIGWNWEKNDPGRGLDFVFSAVLLASVCSVGMQLLQCIFPDLEWLGIQPGLGSRFSGSFGHPNLLGTLHVWGLLGVLWIGRRWRVDWRVSTAIAFWLLIGIALVESRTAWLNVAIGFFVIHRYWKNSRPRLLGEVLGAFAVFLLAMYFFVPWINAQIHDHSAIYRDAYDSARLDLWRVYLQAVLERPWFGYGFGGGREAYIAGDFLNFSAWPSHTHNLVLDVAIYVGAPGAIIFLFALLYLLRCLSSCLKYGEINFIVPALAVLAVLVHAMLEYPLHYAFFLLPAGLILGHFLRVLGVVEGVPVRVWVSYGTLGLVVAVVLITVLEGAKLERVITAEGNAGLTENGKGYVGQFMIFDQWDDRMRFAHIPNNIALTPEISTKINNILVTAPSSDLIQKYVEILSINGATVEAQHWLDILCKTSPQLYKKEVLRRQQERQHEQSRANDLDWRACYEKE